MNDCWSDSSSGGEGIQKAAARRIYPAGRCLLKNLVIGGNSRWRYFTRRTGLYAPDWENSTPVDSNVAVTCGEQPLAGLP